MTRLSVFIASSLDGYIADDHGSLTWLEDCARPDEDYGFDEFISTVDALAMGRGTYDHIAHLDPLPFGHRKVFVFTHQPPQPRPGVTFWQRDPLAALREWQDMGLQRVYVDGGQLISSFLEAGLIDDMLLTKVPLLLGGGRPLFHRMQHQTYLRLLDVRAFPSGLVNLVYRRVQ